jgi:t-SNARE complex subunit (syntaxin)
MEKLTMNQINELPLEEARKLVDSLQNENANLQEQIKKMQRYMDSDGTKLEVVKNILEDLWCC